MIRRLLVFLLSLPLCAAAQDRAQVLLQRMTAAFRALPAYEVRFEVPTGGDAVAGRFAVEGDSYYIALGDAEVFGTADVRYEVDGRRREVTVAPVEHTSQNLLSDPVHAFDFVSAQYAVSLAGEEDGRVRLRLQPHERREAAIVLTLEEATALPAAIRYEAGEEAVDILIRSVERLATPLKRFDRKAFADYEWIDFR